MTAPTNEIFISTTCGTKAGLNFMTAGKFSAKIEANPGGFVQYLSFVVLPDKKFDSARVMVLYEND